MQTREREPQVEVSQPQRMEQPQVEVSQSQGVRPLQEIQAEQRRKAMSGGIVGVILIVVGLMSLAATIWGSSLIGTLILPALGVMFLAWGFWARVPGLMIPGGILTGLGAGILVQQTLLVSASGEVSGGVVVLGLALGFLAIMPLVRLVGGHTYWWPAIPGGILLIVAVALLLGPGGVGLLQSMEYIWPIAPIVVGVYLIWLMYRRRGGQDRDRPGLPS